MTEVSVIILNWNTGHYTISCVKSLLKSTYRDFEVIIVDNGSKKRDIERVMKIFKMNPRIKFILNDKNEGFAEGNNIGYRNISKETKYVVLLNSDMTVGTDWLKEMVHGMKKNPKAKGLGCNNSKQGDKNGTLSIVGFDNWYAHKSLIGKEIRNTLYVSGANFMFAKEIGEPFDKDYFAYAEDVYLGWKIWLKGYEVIRINSKNKNASFTHYKEHTLQKRQKSYAVFLGTRNIIMNLLLFYEAKTLWKLSPLIILSQLLYLLQSPKNIPAKLKAHFWILGNISTLRKKRRKIQRMRKVSDKVILEQMSCKLQAENVLSGSIYRYVLRFFNHLFCGYCKITGIKTKESTFTRK